MKSTSQTKEKQANVVAHNEEYECYTFIARNKESNVNKVDRYINYGASCHFTSKKVWCIDFLAYKTSSNFVIFGVG